MKRMKDRQEENNKWNRMRIKKIEMKEKPNERKGTDKNKKRKIT